MTQPTQDLTHLVMNADGTWNSKYPNGDKPLPLTISGSGFGGAPTPVFFDRINAAAGAEFDLNSPEIGVWSSFTKGSSSTVHPYAGMGGRAWLALRDPTQVSGGLQDEVKGVGVFNIGANVTQFFIAYRMAADPAYIFPRASVAGGALGFSGAGAYKPLWLTDAGNTPSIPDVVMPNLDASGWWLFGNSSYPKYYNPTENNIYAPTTAGNYLNTDGTGTLWGMYQSGDESGTGARDATVSMLRVDTLTSQIVSRTTCDPFVPNSNGGSFSQRSYTGYVAVNAQYGNLQIPYNNVQAYQADWYAAVGANCRACIIASNASTFSAQTVAYIIPPENWTDTSITFRPHARESALGFYHLMLGDGSIINNVSAA